MKAMNHSAVKSQGLYIDKDLIVRVVEAVKGRALEGEGIDMDEDLGNEYGSYEEEVVKMPENLAIS